VHLAGLGQTVTFFALGGKKAASSPKPQMQALFLNLFFVILVDKPTLQI